jgi:hypothetical protein
VSDTGSTMLALLCDRLRAPTPNATATALRFRPTMVSFLSSCSGSTYENSGSCSSEGDGGQDEAGVEEREGIDAEDTFRATCASAAEVVRERAGRRGKIANRQLPSDHDAQSG